MYQARQAFLDLRFEAEVGVPVLMEAFDVAPYGGLQELAEALPEAREEEVVFFGVFLFDQLLQSLDYLPRGHLGSGPGADLQAVY